MSNSTRPGGYDERLVVPLEASRRGAHRARINPLMSALPVFAVVVVVVAVIGVAYTLFVKGSNTTDDNATGTVPTTSAPAATKAAPAPSASSGASSSAKPSTSASASSSTAAATVNKAAPFGIYNGSVNRTTGLAAKARDGLNADGFTKGQVVIGTPPVARSQTTRIYYAKDADKATAEALKDALGVGSVRQNATVAAQRLVVVVGDDYAG
jgi:hypothetical protein